MDNSKFRAELEASDQVGRLILKYAIPSILSGIIAALYNIIDQIFIGQSIGLLGNAATNVAFPLTSMCTAMALMFGIGGAANFSISLGRKDLDKAKQFVGASLSALVVAGLIICVTVNLCLEDLLWSLGATTQNYTYAKEYVSITAWGFPFFIFSLGTSHLIRADGSPRQAMIFTVTGAVLNCVLDAIFIFGLNLGMSGAAFATVISQIVSALLAFAYFFRFKTFRITRDVLLPAWRVLLRVAALGVASATNQLCMMMTQIVSNNVLTSYGADSIYGSDIPLACVGVITKVTTIYIAIAVGLGLGAQPIIGYNFGAKRYDKVIATYKRNMIYVTIISVIFYLVLQGFPRQIVGVFGDGSDEYFAFAERYIRIFMLMAFLNGLHPITANFFTSIGKATRGMFMALTKQALFLTPLILILPQFFGIDGIMYAGPAADVAAFTLAMIFVRIEFKTLRRMQREQDTLANPT